MVWFYSTECAKHNSGLRQILGLFFPEILPLSSSGYF